MTEGATPGASSQLGLLDLAVDLSVPEVYAGTDFTLYLHIKNPFPRAVWVRSVELSLPTQLSWRDAAGKPQEVQGRNWKRIASRRSKIAQLQARLSQLDGASDRRSRRIQRRLTELQAQDRSDGEALQQDAGGVTARVASEGKVEIHTLRARRAELEVAQRGEIYIRNLESLVEPERVPLTSSLPKNASLSPGSTDVWTIRLGTSRSPFILPSRYHLQLTVIYSLEPPRLDKEVSEEHLLANTTSFTVPLKAALWSVILGGIIGAAIGSLARSLQAAQTIDRLLRDQLGAALGALTLAVMLSGAAIVFAARKTDAQSFVTVEDFWGGLLVGFLIGYSGTAAFGQLTGLSSSSGQ
jgi:hypothetical protein